MYEYLYNGGGVAIGDVNGDGLLDIYFSGNTTENKLYLNKGNMQFEDVTSKSGVAGRLGPWKTGVTMADVNGDGWVDIFVCYSGKLPAEKRINQLFINRGPDAGGVPLFVDEAVAFGLSEPSYSTQGYFFDYDKDGDLDLFLLNHNPNSLPVLDEKSTLEVIQSEDKEIGVRLFRNDNNKFVDVTSNAGISHSRLTYGLGAAIADINSDGWPDIYVCNDYSVPDYLYVNNGDGTFADVKKNMLGHTTYFAMGNDIADMNNDGLPDIFTLDMLPEDNHRQKTLMSPDNYEKEELMLRSGFYFQEMRNMLQLNNGDGTFSEVGQLAGLSKTDWSWAPLIADFDNDGWKDVYVTNGYLRDYTNLDFISEMNDFIQKNRGNIHRSNVFELAKKMPSTGLSNYMFRNEGYLTFRQVSQSWGLDGVSWSNGAVYADLDNDGMLDMVVNNINQPAFVYHNISASTRDNHYLDVVLKGMKGNTQGLGAKIKLYSNGKQQDLEQMPARGYQSSVTPVLHFGLGQDSIVDSLRIIWLSGKTTLVREIKANQVLKLEEADASQVYHYPRSAPALFREMTPPLSFEHAPNDVNDFFRQPLMVNPMSFFGPCMAKADVNGDGLEDIYIGGATGQAGALFIQHKNGQFNKSSQPVFDNDKIYEDADAVFFDANGDGYPDLYVASGGYHYFAERDPKLQDRLYLNDGKGNFLKSTGSLPEMHVSKSCVRAADLNGDGYTDLFVGGRVIPGSYPQPPRSYILINNGKGVFDDRTAELAPSLQNPGMVTCAEWADLNGDQKPDLVIAGEWMPIIVCININGKLEDKTNDYFDDVYTGWWNTLRIADVNGDGMQDIIAGNEGLNTRFRANSQEPLEMYYRDFDGNGTIDPFFGFYIQGKSYPFVTRDELLQQMPGMKAKYTTYKSYADQTIHDIFNDNDLKDAGHLSANNLETSYFEMGADNKFHKRPLPVETQFSPVFTITPLDYDKDGKTDLLLCGNINRARLRLGKSDANYGILLKGDGSGNFEYIPQWRSGFKIWGDVRSVLKLENTLLFGINQKPVVAYRINN
ncbi:MAG: VCBS repeat-containing protein [Chitinophagaceae bacterium]|nr:VCBS repeat-containing protein [Chitinophagaceae bacterium]